MNINSHSHHRRHWSSGGGRERGDGGIQYALAICGICRASNGQ